MKNLYSIDINKCEKISLPDEINGIFKSIAIRRKKINMRSGFYLNRQNHHQAYGFIQEHLGFKSIIIDYFKIDSNFQIKPNSELEFFIENDSIVYFFSTEISEFSIKRISLAFPKIIYRINRTDNFRFSPSAENPILVEFYFQKNNYKFYVFDISPGGFSIVTNDEKEVYFADGEMINGVKICFSKEKIENLSAKIVLSREIYISKEKHLLYGVQFLGLKSSVKNFILKNIFLEQKENISLLRKKIT